MIVLLIHEDGSRRVVEGDTWQDISLKMSCADISATVISDCDFDLQSKISVVIDKEDNNDS